MIIFHEKKFHQFVPVHLFVGGCATVDPLLVPDPMDGDRVPVNYWIAIHSVYLYSRWRVSLAFIFCGPVIIARQDRERDALWQHHNNPFPPMLMMMASGPITIKISHRSSTSWRNISLWHLLFCCGDNSFDFCLCPTDPTIHPPPSGTRI